MLKLSRDARYLQKVALNTSGNLIFHRPRIVVPKFLQRHVVELASRSCENQIAATGEFLVSENQQADRKHG